MGGGQGNRGGVPLTERVIFIWALGKKGRNVKKSSSPEGSV